MAKTVIIFDDDKELEFEDVENIERDSSGVVTITFTGDAQPVVLEENWSTIKRVRPLLPPPI